MARIAIGGFQHETNTFSPAPATFAEFEAPDAWPGLTRGPAMLEAVGGINLPAAGFVQAARGLHPWAYWHLKLDRYPAPPLPVRRHG